MNTSRPRRKRKTDQRGQALAMAAVSVVAVIAMGALAVDLGMAFAARTAAQRAADSSALAGASAFIDVPYTDPASVDSANARAMAFATSNDVLAKTIEASQVSIWVIPDSQKVRVSVRAAGLPTWFARVLNVFSMDVSAMAAAVASDGGSTNQCVLPFAIPDIWWDKDNDSGDPPDHIPNNGETWEFDPNIDDYRRFTGADDDCTGLGCNGTGLGSNLRDDYGYPADAGRRIFIKSGSPGHQDDGSGGDAGGTDIRIEPGHFKIWAMPDPDKGCEEPSYGANWTRQNIHVTECNPCEVSVGVDYETEPGNEASLRKPLGDIFDADPNARWNDGTQSIEGSIATDPMDSPRVRVVPLYDPNFAIQGRDDYQFNNFAYIFLEGGGGTGYTEDGYSGRDQNDFAIYARFLGMIPGGSGGPTTGTLVKYLRLVE